MTIRPATSDDVADIAASELTNLGADAWTAALVEQGVAGALPTIRYLVAELDGDVVGHAVASLVADVAELQRIAVDPDHRRHGLATALLAGVLGEAEAHGVDRLLLEVREDNAEAIAFYDDARVRRDRSPAGLLPRRSDRDRHARSPARVIGMAA